MKQLGSTAESMNTTLEDKQIMELENLAGYLAETVMVEGSTVRRN